MTQSPKIKFFANWQIAQLWWICSLTFDPIFEIYSKLQIFWYQSLPILFWQNICWIVLTGLCIFFQQKITFLRKTLQTLEKRLFNVSLRIKLIFKIFMFHIKITEIFKNRPCILLNESDEESGRNNHNLQLRWVGEEKNCYT